MLDADDGAVASQPAPECAAILATRPPVAQPSGMTGRAKDQQKERRNRRLSAALRDNLKRRKAQQRGRAVEAGRATEPHDSAGIGDDKGRREPGS
jgi:hypothetical protein